MSSFHFHSYATTINCFPFMHPDVKGLWTWLIIKHCHTKDYKKKLTIYFIDFILIKQEQKDILFNSCNNVIKNKQKKQNTVTRILNKYSTRTNKRTNIKAFTQTVDLLNSFDIIIAVIIKDYCMLARWFSKCTCGLSFQLNT